MAVTVEASPTTQTDDGPVEAKYWLHPVQQRAMALLGLDERWEHPYGWAVEEMLYGGQAGGGKSLLARCVALTLAHIWPGSRVPVFRRTYPELEETHIVKVQEEWASLGRYHGGTHEWRWHNGSVTPFRHCEREADVFRYLSAEWDGLIVDEATQFSEYQISMLRSRVRSTRVRWRPVILYTANPGGVGHVFFKEGFVDAAPEGTLFDAPKDKGGLKRVFLRARLRDNPSLNAEQYASILAGISDPEMRRAVADGDWDIFSGQYFKLWNRERHVVLPFDLPPSWNRRYISVDWGYGAPWATLFFARDEDLWRGQRIPRWYAYREFYSPGVRDQQQARHIRDAMEEDKASRALVTAGGQRISPAPLVWDCVADPSMWTTSSQTGVSPADIYQAAGVPIMPANNDRVPGWQRVQEYLDVMEDGLPGIQFFETCTNTIRTLPVQQRAKHRPEDLESSGEDHACLAPGTLVDTFTGPRVIEDIQPGEYVRTRSGYYRVRASGATGVRPVRRHEFSNGAMLVATSDHPVHTENRGMVSLHDIRYSDTISVWENRVLLPSKSSTTASPTTAIRPAATPTHGGTTGAASLRENRGIVVSMLPSMPTPTALSLMGTTFTIVTGMLSIMTPLTWSASPKRNISFVTERTEPLGTDPRKDEPGMPITPGASTPRSLPLSTPASNAESRSPARPGARSSSAPMLARPRRVVRAVWTRLRERATSAAASLSRRAAGQSRQPALPSAVRLVGSWPAGTATVYNLSVETDHEFYANGVLVSNCDSLRYFCMTQSGITRAEGTTGVSRGYGLRGQGQGQGAQQGQNATTQKMFERTLARAADPAQVGSNKGGIVRHS